MSQSLAGSRRVLRRTRPPAPREGGAALSGPTPGLLASCWRLGCPGRYHRIPLSVPDCLDCVGQGPGRLWSPWRIGNIAEGGPTRGAG